MALGCHEVMGGWMTTDPEAQGSWFTERRSTVGANLTPICQLVRRWNNVHSHRLDSFHIEVMATNMFSSVGSNHRDALKSFFEWGYRWVNVNDPAGHSGNLGDYLTQAELNSINSRFTEALDRAQCALTAEVGGAHAEARRLWRIELGDEFPS